MNPWKDTLRISTERLAEIRKNQNEGEVHEVFCGLCALLGYPFFALDREVFAVVPTDGQPKSIKTERSIDENGEFEAFFLVKDGHALSGPQGPIAFIDPIEARQMAIRIGGGVVKSFSEIQKANAERSKLIVPA